MNKYKGLIIKEAHTLRKIFMIPIWTFSLIWGIVLLLTLFYFIRSGFKIETIFVDISDYSWEIHLLNNPIQYLLNFVSVVLPGLLMVFVSVTAVNESVNGEKKNGCELFYRTMPVSTLQITSAKILVAIVGSWAGTFLFILFNFIVINSVFVFSFGEIFNISLSHMLSGMFYGFIPFLLMTVLFGSITFLFSSIIREHAVIKGFGFLILMDIVLIIFHRIFNYSLKAIPTFSNLLAEATKIYGETMRSFDFSYSEIIFPNFSVFLTIRNFQLFIISALLFFIGNYFYKKREIL